MSTNSNSVLPEEWQTPTVYLAMGSIILYVVTTIIGGSFIVTGGPAIRLFGNSMNSLLAGMIWVPITSLFTHGSIAHLGSNLIFLFAFGFKMEERGYSDKGIYLAYFLTGLIAGFLSILVILEPQAITVGSSGAVFGILGVNYGVEKKSRNPNSKSILGLSLLFFIMSSGPNTNVFSHLFGWIAGMVLGSSNYYQQFNTKLDEANIFCWNCGARLRENNARCNACGSSQNTFN